MLSNLRVYTTELPPWVSLFSQYTAFPGLWASLCRGMVSISYVAYTTSVGFWEILGGCPQVSGLETLVPSRQSPGSLTYHKQGQPAMLGCLVIPREPDGSSGLLSAAQLNSRTKADRGGTYTMTSPETGESVINPI